MGAARPRLGLKSRLQPQGTSMLPVNLWWLLLIPAYLLGTFPTAHLVGRVVGRNPSTEGSKNPGATNMYRLAGRIAGAFVLLGDILKGVAATLIALLLAPRSVALGCAIAAVIGHIAPITRKFRGGKGVATYGGSSLVLWPYTALGTILLWLIITKWSGRPSVGSLVAVPLLPVGITIEYALGRWHWWEPVSYASLALLVVCMHRDNIQRLINREEKRMQNVFTRGA